MNLRLWMIAASFGDPASNSLAQTVVGSWLAESSEVATAQFVSKYYYDGGSRLALIGITAMELSPDVMRECLATIEKAAQEPPKVAPLTVVQGPPQGLPLPQGPLPAGAESDPA